MNPDAHEVQIDASDERILAACRRGDTAAFRRLVERHQRYAFALAFRVLLDEEDAREVVQEGFVRVWKHIGSFDGRSRFTTWLYGIVTRCALDRAKANRRRLRVMTRFPGNDLARICDASQDPGAIAANREITEKIRAVAGDLPPAQRAVFVLRDLHDLSVAEVAEELGMSAGSVKMNLSLARARIRRILEEWEGEGGTNR